VKRVDRPIEVDDNKSTLQPSEAGRAPRREGYDCGGGEKDTSGRRRVDVGRRATGGKGLTWLWLAARRD
jgi:hypothetical protein